MLKKAASFIQVVGQKGQNGKKFETKTSATGVPLRRPSDLPDDIRGEDELGVPAARPRRNRNGKPPRPLKSRPDIGLHQWFKPL